MFETLSMFSIILSLSIGSVIGLMLYLKFGLPRSEKWAFALLLGLIISPIFGAEVYLFGNVTSAGALEGIVIAPLLFGVFGCLNLCFVLKKYKLHSLH